MSIPEDNNTVRMRNDLFTETREYRASMGVFRFTYDWINDAHAMLETESPTRLLVVLEELHEHYRNFNEACSTLLGGLDPTIDAQEYEEVRARSRSTQGKVFDLKQRLQAIRPPPQATGLSAFSTPLKYRRSTGQSLDGPSNRLPDLPIPKFDGRADSWIGFIDQFDSVVDSQFNLAPTLKLQYLVSALSEEPRRLLMHLKIEGGNYRVARDLLKSRYHNTRVLADNYINQILTLPEITTKLAGLRAMFLNPLLMAYRCLERLELPVRHWSYLLVHIALTKLPQDLKSRFERRYGGDLKELPKFDQLVAFLEEECRHHDNVGHTYLVDAVPHSLKSYSRPPPAKHAYVAAPRPPSPPEPRPTCYKCQSDCHYLRECPEFLEMSPRNRSAFVKSAGLCYRCLDKHPIASCRREYRCRTCGRSSHHTVLCFNDGRNPEYPAPRRVSFQTDRDVQSRSPSPRIGGGDRRHPAARTGGVYNATYTRRSPPRSSPSPPRRSYSPRGSSSYERHRSRASPIRRDYAEVASTPVNHDDRFRHSPSRDSVFSRSREDTREQ